MNKSHIESKVSANAMIQLINGYQISQGISVVASLGIADLLKDGTRTIGDLAEATGTHCDTLYRLMRALAAVGIFHENDDRGFELTKMGDCLRSDAPDPVGPWAALIGRPYLWNAWPNLLHSVKTGENAFRATHGMSIWEYRATHKVEGTIFDAAMTAISGDVTDAVISTYDFSSFARIVDVGGGLGSLLAGILIKNSDTHGILLDQPHVIVQAESTFKDLLGEHRYTLVAGDFFDKVPDADLCLLKAILHDWGDTQAIEILKVCRRAIAPSGRILVLERVIAPPNQMAADKFADINMLVGPGGQERTEAEFRALFLEAGLRLSRMIPTTTRMSLIEAVCV